MSNICECLSHESEDIIWDENLVQFKDPVHGYIGVPKVYTNNLIDTSYMQRLKGVAQSGIRPLFSAATHDRFSHSLGVYMFANKAYKNLKENMCILIDNNTSILSESKEELKKDLESWKCLIDIAALLHDIGHPAGSHSFEFLYDDIFLQLNDGKDTIDLTEDDLWEKQWEYNKDIYETYFKHSSTSSESPYENSILKKTLRKILLDNDNDELNGNPHERMSAYIILKEEDLNTVIKKLICSYWKSIGKAQNNEDVDRAIKFICRIIIGQDYLSAYSADFLLENYRNSMKNCIIKIVNGILDADSMDYIMRNSYSAGYATHTIDCARLCSAFTVVEKQNIMESCFAKTALSVIEGFITARNFEPKWLYSHHKVVYYDVLLKSIYHYCVKFMCYLNFTLCSDNLREKYNKIEENFNKNAENDFDIKKSYSNEYSMNCWSYPYYTYILATRMPFYSKNYNLYTTVDADLEFMFKSIYLDLKNDKIPFKTNKLFTNEDKIIFQSLLGEYENRKLKKSLWKSYAEYRLVIKEVGCALGLSDDMVHNYMIDMIKNGLYKWNFGIGQYPSEKFPKSYEEQYIYRPYTSEETINIPLDADMIKYFARNNANDVFGAFPGEYELSHRYCVCKIYTAKFKRFDKLSIKFDNISYKLEDVINIANEKSFEFPYIFYSNKVNDNSDAYKVKRNFIKKFKLYCAKRLECETNLKGNTSMINLICKQHVIRDVVHGDITFSDEYWDIINTKEFQRLRRIKQLATASQVFPNATHTRFAHSIGTYHIMKMIVEHFQKIFNDLHLDNIDMQDAPIALLAALLHDIGHGPFSHAFESIATDSINHEEWAKRIVLDENTEIHQVIVRNFGRDVPRKVVDCINNVIQEKNNNINFSMIYSGLVSGSLDADRMDYLMRDSYNTNTQFSSIDIQNIISSMRIAQINGIYYVCYDESYLSFIEQLIFTRYEMYDNIYFNSYKVLSESLVKNILQRAYQKRNLLKEDERTLLDTIFSANIKTEDFLKLDDNLINYYFYQWKDNHQDKVLSEMCRALIDRTSYNEIYVADQSESNFQRLLYEIEKICEYKEGALTDNNSRKFFGIIKETRRIDAYPDEQKPLNANKTIWIMKKNGTVVDFRNQTRLYNLRGGHFSRIHKSYAYFSKIIMREELINQKKSIMTEKNKEEIDLRLAEIDSLIKSFVPRNNIEIEEKYRCDKKILDEVEIFLLKGQGVKTFKLKSGFKNIMQKDVYYDTIDRKIEKYKCSLRIRNIDNKYICTIKLPVNSDNFGGDSQYARFEYETTRDSGELSGFSSFIDAHLKINGVSIIKEPIMSDNITKIFTKTLEIENNRKKGTIIRDSINDNFSCEICLDNVKYMRDNIEKKDYQIEIELKSDYLHHVILKVFTNKLEEKFGDYLQREEKSKYERGLIFMNISQS